MLDGKRIQKFFSHVLVPAGDADLMTRSAPSPDRVEKKKDICGMYDIDQNFHVSGRPAPLKEALPASAPVKSAHRGVFSSLKAPVNSNCERVRSGPIVTWVAQKRQEA